MSYNPNTVEVDVKSGWASKINWTQAVGLLATVLALIGIDLDPQTQVAVVAGIQAIVAVVTWVLRTFFTKAVTAAAVK